MNYYKQGDAANADKIRAAFERNGIDTSANSNYGISNLFYFSCNGEVAVTQNGSIINIIKTHPDYKELELPVEPFKVGDWIVRGKGFVYEPSLITEIRDYYICELLNGERVTYTLNDVHKNFHLWSIQDAKDGDVLVNDAGCIFINAGFEKDDKVTLACYCYVSVQGIFYEEDYKTGSWLYVSHIHPATKEQCDLLFKKMKEAGYQWDADKKELRKIQPHYDIENFYAGMPVLIRDAKGEEWRYTEFSHLSSRFETNKFCAGCTYWRQCIPFNDETKHLLGTSDMCDKRFINW